MLFEEARAGGGRAGRHTFYGALTVAIEGKRLVYGSALFALAMLGLTAFTGVEVADANNPCAAQCHASYQQCMMQTKGSPQCGAALTSCLQTCR